MSFLSQPVNQTSVVRVLQLILAGLSIWLGRYVWRRADLYRRKRRAERLHGCKDAVRYPHTDQIRGSDLTALRKEALTKGRLARLWTEQHRALGETWQEQVDGKTRVNTISGPNFRYMYAQHMSQFQRGMGVNSTSKRFVGTAGFMADGEEWRFTRRSVDPTFSKYETGTMPMLKVHVDRFMAELPRAGDSFDAQPLIKKLFLDLATEFLFGEPLGLQLPGKREEGEQFLRLMDSCLLGLNKRRLAFSWLTVKLWFDNSFARECAKVHAFIDTRVEAAIQRTSKTTSQSGKTDASITENPAKPSRYVLVDELAKQTQDREFLRSCMLQCFLPGRDSTAILTSNTLFALSRHPEYWTRLRPLALALSESETLSFPTLVALHPIRHVILESLRFHGPGGPNSRLTCEDVVFPEGGGPDGKSPLFVAKGTIVATHLLAMHRNKKYWGEDADVWRPERFVGHQFSDWEFRPFLAGPRTCPAKDQVIMQITYILVRLMREWEGIECRDEVKEFVEMMRLTTESKRGARIALVGKAEVA